VVGVVPEAGKEGRAIQQVMRGGGGDGNIEDTVEWETEEEE